MKQILTPDKNPLHHPDLPDLDAQRRGRVQEGVAIGLAIAVLIATFLVAGFSVAGGTVPSASRIENPDAIPPSALDDQCLSGGPVIVDDLLAGDRVCPLGS